MITTSESVADLFPALITARGKFTQIQKTKTNPHLKNKYADMGDILSAIGPALSGCNLMVVQSVEKPENGISVTTRIIHGSGQWIEYGPTTLPVDKPSPQAAGSAITYARRYALSAALCLVADDDDDGNGAGVTKASGKEAADALKARKAGGGNDDGFL